MSLSVLQGDYFEWMVQGYSGALPLAGLHSKNKELAAFKEHSSIYLLMDWEVRCCLSRSIWTGYWWMDGGGGGGKILVGSV